MLQLLESSYARKAEKTVSAVHPPFSGMVLEPDLVPTPAKFGHAIRTQRYRHEALAIEAVQESPGPGAANGEQIPGPALEERDKECAAQPVRFGIGADPVAGDFHGAAAHAAQPKVAMPIFG